MMMMMTSMMTKVTIKQNGEICMRCKTVSINGRRVVIDQTSVCLIAAISIRTVLKEDRLSCISGFTAPICCHLLVLFFLLADNKEKES